MKILVFADSHRSISYMRQAVEEEKPDQVIHLGDLMRDAEELAEEFPKIPVCMVPGNCDGWTMVLPIKRITLQGRNFLLSHGHLWKVKQGYDLAIAEAQKAGVEFLLFGHTHRALCQQQESGLWVINPGSAPSYGVIQLEGERTACRIVRTGAV